MLFFQEFLWQQQFHAVWVIPENVEDFFKLTHLTCLNLANATVYYTNLSLHTTSSWHNNLTTNVWPAKRSEALTLTYRHHNEWFVETPVKISCLRENQYCGCWWSSADWRSRIWINTLWTKENDWHVQKAFSNKFDKWKARVLIHNSLKRFVSNYLIDSKPLPEPMLTKIDDNIWHHETQWFN